MLASDFPTDRRSVKDNPTCLGRTELARRGRETGCVWGYGKGKGHGRESLYPGVEAIDDDVPRDVEPGSQPLTSQDIPQRVVVEYSKLWGHSGAACFDSVTWDVLGFVYWACNASLGMKSGVGHPTAAGGHDEQATRSVLAWSDRLVTNCML